MTAQDIDHLIATSGHKERLDLPASRRDLCQWLAQWGHKAGAEIGVWEGQFSEVICQANPGVQLTCVDPWVCYAAYVDKKNDPARIEGAYQATVKRLAPYGCAIKRMTSLEAARTVPDGSLDFVYLDANHAAAFVWQDLNAWAPKVRKGGIVAGHDYHSHRGKHLGVKPMVHKYLAEHGIAPLLVLAGDKSASFAWVQP